MLSLRYAAQQHLKRQALRLHISPKSGSARYRFLGEQYGPTAVSSATETAPFDAERL